MNKTNMKYLLITMGTLSLLALILLYGRAYDAKTYQEKLKTAAQEEKFDTEAKRIKEILYNKSKEYQAKEAQKNDLQKKMIELQASFSALQNDEEKIAETARYYDAILCKDYKAVYKRPLSSSGANAGSGLLIQTDDCSFLPGAQPAL